MSTFPKSPDIIRRVKDLERREHRSKGYIFDYDPDERPQAVTGVDLDMRVQEKKDRLRFKARVRWDAVPPGSCQADILEYRIELQPTDSAGTPKEAGRKKFASYVVRHWDDGEADDLQVHFNDLEHPGKWYWRARVRAIDRDGRHGVWSEWTAPLLPLQDANPSPPYPDNIVLTFDKNEKGRDEARYRAIVRFDEIKFWDVPPQNEVDTNEDTLDGALAAGANEIKVSSLSGFPLPPAKERYGLVIRPNSDNAEIISYSGKDSGTSKLTGVKRGLEGTSDIAHPDGAKIKFTKKDAQERINDLRGYDVQIRRWNPNTSTWVLDDDGKHVQRSKFQPWQSEFDDGDDLVRAVFPNVRKRHTWKARVRTVDDYGRKGDWSDWSNVGSPSDTDAPPQPNGVTVEVDNNKVHVDWETEYSVEDLDQPHEDIAYFQVELHKNSSYTDLVKRDYFVITTKKTFKVKKAQRQYWARVRSVDASGNKSSWITSNANKQRPPMPSAPSSITFDETEKEKGAKLRAKVNFTYNELGYNEDHIDRYIVQAIITRTVGYTGTEERRRTVLDIAGDDDETDANDPKVAVFKGVKRRHWMRARVRAIDKNNRKSDWSPWSSSYQIADSTSSPAPTSVSIESDVKGVYVDWEAPVDTYQDSGGNEQNDSDDTVHNDISHYEVEVHTNGSFTNRVRRDKHVVQTKKRFKGLSEGMTFYARVRSVSSTGTKSGWVGSNGVTTTAQVDRVAIVDNSIDANKIDTSAVNTDEIAPDAVKTDELDDSGNLVGTGTWRNSSGATRVEIDSTNLNYVRMFHSGLSQPGGLTTSPGNATITVAAPNSSGLFTGARMDLSHNLGELQCYGFDEITVALRPVRSACGLSIPGSQVGAGDVWGQTVNWSGFTRRTTTPSSVTLMTLGTDNNVSSVSVNDITDRGFQFRVTASAAGAFLRAQRLAVVS